MFKHCPTNEEYEKSKRSSTLKPQDFPTAILIEQIQNALVGLPVVQLKLVLDTTLMLTSDPDFEKQLHKLICS